MIEGILDYHEKIGKYLLLEEIGKGGSGTVYKAKDIELGRFVAVKKLTISNILSVEQKKEESSRFMREAVTLASLSHPNILSVYEIIRGENNSIIMELLDGMDLSSYYQANKLSLDTLLYIFIQIAEALEYIHSRDIIHRDIKPENITILQKNKVKLTDFGISTSKDNISFFNDETLAGTLNYMSPEQIFNKNIDHRTDIFSFGVLMYEILTNKNPFKENTVQKIVNNIFSLHPVSPSDIDDNIPVIISDIVMQCLEKDVDKRFQTAHEIYEKLTFERLKLNIINMKISITETNSITLPTRENPPANIINMPDFPKTNEINSFSNYGLVEILNTFISNKSTGKLILNNESSDNAEICFKNGNITNAKVSYKNLIAIDAFYEIVVWESGQFSFEEGVITTAKSEFEFMPTDLLLMDAENILKEYHILRYKYKRNIYLKFSGNLKEVYDPRALEVIKLINANNSVIEIKTRANMDRLSILQIIDKLFKQTMIFIV